MSMTSGAVAMSGIRALFVTGTGPEPGTRAGMPRCWRRRGPTSPARWSSPISTTGPTCGPSAHAFGVSLRELLNLSRVGIGTEEGSARRDGNRRRERRGGGHPRGRARNLYPQARSAWVHDLVDRSGAGGRATLRGRPGEQPRRRRRVRQRVSLRPPSGLAGVSLGETWQRGRRHRRHASRLREFHADAWPRWRHSCRIEAGGDRAASRQQSRRARPAPAGQCARELGCLRTRPEQPRIRGRARRHRRSGVRGHRAGSVRLSPYRTRSPRRSARQPRIVTRIELRAARSREPRGAPGSRRDLPGGRPPARCPRRRRVDHRRR